MIYMAHILLDVNRVSHLNDKTDGMIMDTEAPVKMMMLFCASCKEVKAIPSRRGRPPKHCNECTNNGDVEDYEASRLERDRAIANERLDRLEMMLKSRGTHISQNRNGKYDR